MAVGMGNLSQRLQFLISANADEAIRVFQKTGDTAEKELGKADTKIDKMGASLTKFGAGAMAFSGVAAGGLFKLSQVASDTAESVNAVTVTFGEASDGVLKLSEDAAQSVGMAQSDFNQLSVSLAGFAKQMGGDVVGTIDDMTTRIADFASVMNLDVNEAATTFRSALAGESEAMRRYGIDISAAAVETYALANGIASSAASMTEAQKVQARYGLIMQETSQWAGDFANTADSAANQQRILTAELQNAASEIGAGVLPVVTHVVSGLGDLVGAFGNLPGPVKNTVGAVAGFGTVAIGAAGAVSFIAGQVIKFRENLGGLGRHLYSAQTGLTGLGTAAVGASVALFGLTEYQRTAAKRQRELNDALAELDKLSGEQFMQGIADTLFAGALAGNSFTETFVELGDTAPGTLQRVKDELDAYATSVGGAANLSDDQREALDAVNEALEISAERHVQASKDAAANSQAQDKFAASAKAGAVSTEEAADRAEYYAARLDGLAHDAENAKGAGERLTAAVETQQSAFERAQDAASDFSSALEEAMGGGLNLEEANQAVIEGLDALTSSVAENGSSLDILTEKGRANRDAIADQVSNIMDMGSALVENGMSAEDAAGYMDAYRQQLIDQAVASGMSQDAVEELLAALGLTPETKATTLKVLKAEETKEKLLGILDTIESIDPETEAEIKALIDDGKFGQAKKKLDELDDDREPAVKPEVDPTSKSAAETELNDVARDRTATITVRTVGAPGSVTSDRDRDGTPDVLDNFPDNPLAWGFDPSGRAAGGTGSKPAIMPANQLWQQALSAWGRGSGMSERDRLKRRFNNELERGRRKYQVGDFGGARYFAYLQGLLEKYDWPRLSDEWMALWQEMDRVLRDMDVDFNGMDAQGGTSAGGSSASAGSSGGGGVPAGSGARSGSGGRVTNINIELRGLFIGTEAEMRRAVRPLVPAISRELDKYERSQG